MERSEKPVLPAFAPEWAAITVRRIRVRASDTPATTGFESYGPSAGESRGASTAADAEIAARGLQAATRPPARRAERLVRTRKLVRRLAIGARRFGASLLGREYTPPGDEHDEKEARDESALWSYREPPENLAGLALSGGGIRSATFCLGVLQGLHAAGALRLFDYLSTVSGGGFVGGWWSAWLARPERRHERGLLFPIEEKLEPSRYPPELLEGGAGARPIAELPHPSRADDRDASLSAQDADAIHHLRLFANYLTPRTGALSADTWRAIAVITRNIVLTWLVLLPLLLAAIEVSQLYFLAREPHATHFVCGSSATPPPACANVVRAVASAGGDYSLTDRLSYAAEPVAWLGIGIVVLTALWLLHASSSLATVLLGYVVLAVIAVLLLRGDGGGTAWWPPAAWPARAWWTLAIAAPLALWYGVFPAFAKQTLHEDVLRNRIVHRHAALLVAATLLAVLLAFAGFGHELVGWFASGARNAATKAGGWAALIAAAASGIFTALKSLPSPAAADRPPAASSGVVTRAIFAVAPVLVLLALSVSLAWAGHWMVANLATAQVVDRLLPSVTWGAWLVAAFAFFETCREPDIDLFASVAQGASALGGAALAAWLGRDLLATGAGASATYKIGLAVVWIVVFRLLCHKEPAWLRKVGSGLWSPLALRALALSRHRPETQGATPWDGKVIGALSITAASFVAGLIAIVVFLPFGSAATLLASARVPVAGDGARLALAGLGFCAVYTLLDIVFARANHTRGLGLIGVAAAIFGAVAMLHFLPHDDSETNLRFVAFGVGSIGLTIVWVLGLGWMLNPNMLSVHTFYKARLVRAYLGASNTRRNVEITETAPGDDVPLTELWNHDAGAPYHLVNTTLNLVGGHDLATAQRYAANFVLSRYLCGSSRTGYRRTRDYMNGALSLGTAVAVSGAAASPTMGSKTPSAALAMLLALFNVRLGFWAPTPPRSRWREPQPRLWPFYLLHESLSQTNDLGSYCYLTDGGHFDNTGLYSLVERGCRYIMLIDCGADPQPCFSDLGDAIRRCRIDFGAEISLDVDQFLEQPHPDLRSTHFVVGEIHYDRRHLEMLGWTPQQIAANSHGVIVWVKPMVTKFVTADVRQYQMENHVFPQQTTADQWFDEAQFESYRALGRRSIGEMIDPVPQQGRTDASTFFDALGRRYPAPGVPAGFRL